MNTVDQRREPKAWVSAANFGAETERLYATLHGTGLALGRKTLPNGALERFGEGLARQTAAPERAVLDKLYALHKQLAKAGRAQASQATGVRAQLAQSLRAWEPVALEGVQRRVDATVDVSSLEVAQREAQTLARRSLHPDVRCAARAVVKRVSEKLAHIRAVERPSGGRSLTIGGVPWRDALMILALPSSRVTNFVRRPKASLSSPAKAGSPGPKDKRPLSPAEQTVFNDALAKEPRNVRSLVRALMRSTDRRKQLRLMRLLGSAGSYVMSSSRGRGGKFSKLRRGLDWLGNKVVFKELRLLRPPPPVGATSNPVSAQPRREPRTAYTSRLDLKYEQKIMRDVGARCQPLDLVIAEENEKGEARPKAYLVLPAGSGDMITAVTQKKLSAATGRAFMREVAMDLERLHEAGYVHFDIKLENVVFNDAGAMMVIDYGLAAHVSEERVSVRGTRGMCSPEAMRGEVDAAADTWSTAIAWAQLVTGSYSPFLPRGSESDMDRIEAFERWRSKLPRNRKTGALAVKSLLLRPDKKNPFDTFFKSCAAQDLDMTAFVLEHMLGSPRADMKQVRAFMALLPDPATDALTAKTELAEVAQKDAETVAEDAALLAFHRARPPS